MARKTYITELTRKDKTSFGVYSITYAVDWLNKFVDVECGMKQQEPSITSQQIYNRLKNGKQLITFGYEEADIFCPPLDGYSLYIYKDFDEWGKKHLDPLGNLDAGGLFNVRHKKNFNGEN